MTSDAWKCVKWGLRGIVPALLWSGCGAPEAEPGPSRWLPPAVAERKGALTSCSTEADCGGSGLACVAGQCQPCTAHSQCGSDLCDVYGANAPPLLPGRCLAESSIVYVRQTSSCAGGDGTKARPVCTIGQALPRVSGARFAVRVARGTYNEPLNITDRTVFLYGDPEVGTVLGGGTGVRVNGARARVVLDGFRIASMSDAGVTCSAGELQVRRSELVSNREGIVAQGCALRVDRALVTWTDRRALAVLGSSTYRIANSMIIWNGEEGVYFGDGSSGQFLFNTLFRNGGGGVQCGATARVLSDSIVAGNYPYQVSGACNLARMAVSGYVPLGTDGQLLEGPESAACCIDRADRWPSSVPTDYFGTPRPQGAGNDIGAYEMPVPQQLIRNAEFEQGSGSSPDAWSPFVWQAGRTTFTWGNGLGMNGSRGVSVDSTLANDAAWLQTLTVPAGQAYTVTGYMKGQNIVPQEGGRTGANLAIWGTWDSSGSDGSLGTFDWKPTAMTFLAPPSGSVLLATRLGFWASTMTGRAWFDQLAMHGLSKVSGDHVYLMLEPEDLKYIRSRHLRLWVDHLDAAYASYLDLIGTPPYGGSAIGILSVQQYPGGWAVAGNPILWQARYVRPTLADNIGNGGDWSFGILHELGHDFTREGWSWNWEYWANMKMYYVVQQHNAKVILGRSYVGTELKQYYKTDTPNGGYDQTIARGGFSYDALTYCMIRIAERVGWEPYKQTFRYFLSSGANPPTRLAKFRLFLDKLTEYSGVDVRGTFLPGELAAVEAGITAG